MIKLPAFSTRQAAWIRDLRPILERTAFVIYLGIFVVSCGLIGLGMIFAFLLHEVRPLCVGLAGGALARILQQHGYRVWNFARWEDTFEPSDAAAEFGEDAGCSAFAEKFERVLRDLEASEGGGASREVWAVQALRNQAKELLTAEPALRDRFASRLAHHPELG